MSKKDSKYKSVRLLPLKMLKKSDKEHKKRANEREMEIIMKDEERRH